MKRIVLSLFTILLALPLAAGAQHIRVILPVGPGSGMDGTVRSMSAALATAFGQQVVLENLPGAGGVPGTHQLVKAAPDGRTIAVVTNNHTTNPHVIKDVPFHAVNDVTPIMVVGATPFVLLAHPSLPASNVRELVALAKQKPKSINYGSSGNGTILHLAGQMLLTESGIEMTHVPYKAAGQLMTDLIGGQIDAGFFAVSGAAQHVKSGKLKALGVSTPKRTDVLPDVPTIAEQGLPAYSLDGWFAVIGPAKLPAAEVKRILDAFQAAISTPEVRESLHKQGYVIHGWGPEQTTAHFRAELAKYERLVKAAGVKID